MGRGGHAKAKGEQRLKRLTDHPHRGGFGLKDTDPRVTAAKEHLAKVSADAERIGRRYDERSAAWTAGSRTSEGSAPARAQ